MPRHAITIFAVTDLARSVAFYRAAFGWEPRVEVPVFVQLAVPDGPDVGLYDRASFAANTGVAPALPSVPSTGGAELYFVCEDLDVAIERMAAAGGRLLSARAPRSWGDEVAYFADPDGNVLALADGAG